MRIRYGYGHILCPFYLYTKKICDIINLKHNGGDFAILLVVLSYVIGIEVKSANTDYFCGEL